MSIFLLKLRMLKSCRISSLFFGIYVKLYILKKLYLYILNAPLGEHKLAPLEALKGAPTGVQKRAPGSQKGAPTEAQMVAPTGV